MPHKRHRIASLIASTFASGDSKREIASRIAYPFASHDEAPARWVHRRFHGVEPDLGNPRGLDEKICWLKVHDRRPLLTRMSCKFEAREVVRERGFGHLLKQTYGAWDRAEDIDFDALPDKFALKATHGTKLNFFHPSGQAPDRGAIVKIAQRWLETDLAARSGQWGYRNIKPRILAEELLPLPKPYGLPELRVWCFGGNPHFIRRSRSFTDGPSQPGSLPEPVRGKGLFIDLNWNRLPIDNPISGIDELPDRPDDLDELLAAARALSRDMPLARIDFTDSNGRLFFSEITLYPNNGCNRWSPPETDLILGNLVDLPDAADLR